MPEAVATIRNLGPGTLIAKMDLQNAYSVLPIHNPHLGISWGNATFIDTALSFGLRSAPKTFCVC